MLAPVKIRKAELTDVEEIAAIIADNFDFAMPQHSAAVRQSGKTRNTPDKLTGQLQWKEVYVLETPSGEIVGTGALADFGTPEQHKLSISNFFISPTWHRHGLGTMLMQYLIRLAEKRGEIELHVPSSRTGLSFYTRFGFTVDRFQPLDDVRMEITWMTKPLA